MSDKKPRPRPSPGPSPKPPKVRTPTTPVTILPGQKKGTKKPSTGHRKTYDEVMKGYWGSAGQRAGMTPDDYYRSVIDPNFNWYQWNKQNSWR